MMSASASTSTIANGGPSGVDKGSTANSGMSHATTAMQQSRVHPRSFLTANIDQGQTLLQLTGYCFLTGFTSAPTFLACYLWCGFQTGGLVQLSLAVARLFASSPRDTTFHKADQQALTSLLSFLVGTSIGRIGDKVGPRRRWWIMTATFIMALLTMAASLCAHFSAGPSIAEFRTEAGWQDALGMAALGFASASLGLQGIVSKRINSQFGTAVVLTTVWVELLNDPKLLVPKLVKSRDHRLIAVFSVFLGGMCSAGIVFASSSAVAFGVTTGLRLISVLSWLLVPMDPAA
ncbi:YoaK family protein [Sporobolomyces koalae]|uniref:YoaK family protein n=1 Tax=Sporobolomyces koalae TaxID=500713 RepID=UPI003175C555